MSQEQKMTAFSFDASTVTPEKPLEILPSGWQNFEITDASVVATRGAAAGRQVIFEMTVCDGEFKGRKVWHRINAQNKSAKAQEIGQRELSAVCHAVGIINVSDLTPFVGKRLQGRVKVVAATEDYDAKNEIKGIKAIEGAAAMGAIGGAFVPSAPVAATFPPAGWLAHPSAQGYFYNQATNEVKTEADLRACVAPPVLALPVAPLAVVAPPIAPPAPIAPVAHIVEAFPPEGWVAHPQAPGHYYKGQEVKSEADLRAMSAPALPPAPVAPPAVPAAPVAPSAPAAPVTGSVPPWAVPA
jgi:hypothetical protein